MKKIFSSKAKRNLIILTIFIVIVIIVFSIFYKTSSNIEKERKQIKYDSNMISMYIDGEMVDSLDSTKKYNLVNYMCANEETVTWNSSNYSLSVTPLTKKSKCILYFEEKIPSFSITVDGPSSGNYYLTSSSCNNEATLGLDKDTNKLYMDNYSTHFTEIQPLFTF